MLLELVAVVCAGLFAGAAMYISFVEHPARLECGTALAATEFVPSYRRAALMQASLAAVGFLSALAAAFQGRGLPVLLAGVLLGLVIPFTLLVILPTKPAAAGSCARSWVYRGRRPAKPVGSAPCSSKCDERGGVRGTCLGSCSANLTSSGPPLGRHLISACSCRPLQFRGTLDSAHAAESPRLMPRSVRRAPIIAIMPAVCVPPSGL